MAAHFDLNNAPPMELPDWDLYNDPPIYWDAVAEREGSASHLDCHFVWNYGQDQGEVAQEYEGVAEQGDELGQGAEEEELQAVAFGFDLNMDAQGDEDSHFSPSDVGAAPAPAEGSKKRKRRYYSDTLKVAIYLDLLAKTDPPVLRPGVSKQIAQKFNVPLRTVQSVWRKGQDYGGAEGVKNKFVENCGRKRVEIDRSIQTSASEHSQNHPGPRQCIGSEEEHPS
ncbi:hypothetical protein PR202_ga23095 [Eleusine coracana subsp. coracana]|uniref:DUF7769 domain-containing protein n=1 Tax=Eleusine coracana subsp. coracana TaxID=191504 RepID=A0AAV5D4B2_ELECO|nr:hypothetical protein QOZ80_1AG0014050 [Eleusine coracana subsp. coracana]GJN05469.1 hypothetical protein PR202_ga23095 [Eleusine coracana subsp. coracana]